MNTNEIIAQMLTYSMQQHAEKDKQIAELEAKLAQDSATKQAQTPAPKEK